MSRPAKLRVEVEDKALDVHQRKLERTEQSVQRLQVSVRAWQHQISINEQRIKSLTASLNNKSTNVVKARLEIERLRISNERLSVRVSQGTKNIDMMSRSLTNLKNTSREAIIENAKAMHEHSRSYAGFITQFTKLSIGVFLARRALGQLSAAARSFDMERALGNQIENVSEKLQELRNQTRNTLNDTALMQAMGTADAFGISQEQMISLADMAQRLAIRSGEETSKVLNQLIDGVGRLRPTMFQNVGIAISLEEAYSKYANSLGKSVQQMTEFEKRQAVINHLLETGGKLVTGIDIDQATRTNLERISTWFANATEKVAGLGVAAVGVWARVFETNEQEFNRTVMVAERATERMINLQRHQNKALEEGDTQMASFLQNLIDTQNMTAWLTSDFSELATLISGSGWDIWHMGDRPGVARGLYRDLINDNNTIAAQIVEHGNLLAEQLRTQLSITETRQHEKEFMNAAAQEYAKHNQFLIDQIKNTNLSFDSIQGMVEAWRDMNKEGAVFKALLEDHFNKIKQIVGENEARSMFLSEILVNAKVLTTEYERHFGILTRGTKLQQERNQIEVEHSIAQEQLNKAIEQFEKEQTDRNAENLLLHKEIFREVSRRRIMSEHQLRAENEYKSILGDIRREHFGLSKEKLEALQKELGGKAGLLELEYELLKLTEQNLTLMGRVMAPMTNLRIAHIRSLIDEINSVDLALSRFEKTNERTSRKAVKDVTSIREIWEGLKGSLQSVSDKMEEVAPTFFDRFMEFFRERFRRDMEWVEKQMLSTFGEDFRKAFDKEALQGWMVIDFDFISVEQAQSALDQIQTLRERAVGQLPRDLFEMFPELERLAEQLRDMIGPWQDVAKAINQASTAFSTFINSMRTFDMFGSQFTQDLSSIQRGIGTLSEGLIKGKTAYDKYIAAMPLVTQLTKHITDNLQVQAAIQMLMEAGAAWAAFAAGNIPAGIMHSIAAKTYGLVAGGVVKLPSKEADDPAKAQQRDDRRGGPLHIHIHGPVLQDEADRGVLIHQALQEARAQGRV